MLKVSSGMKPWRTERVWMSYLPCLNLTAFVCKMDHNSMSLQELMGGGVLNDIMYVMLCLRPPLPRADPWIEVQVQVVYLGGDPRNYQQERVLRSPLQP